MHKLSEMMSLKRCEFLTYLIDLRHVSGLDRGQREGEKERERVCVFSHRYGL